MGQTEAGSCSSPVVCVVCVCERQRDRRLFVNTYAYVRTYVHHNSTKGAECTPHFESIYASGPTLTDVLYTHMYCTPH